MTVFRGRIAMIKRSRGREMRRPRGTAPCCCAITVPDPCPLRGGDVPAEGSASSPGHAGGRPAKAGPHGWAGSRSCPMLFDLAFSPAKAGVGGKRMKPGFRLRPGMMPAAQVNGCSSQRYDRSHPPVPVPGELCPPLPPGIADSRRGQSGRFARLPAGRFVAKVETFHFNRILAFLLQRAQGDETEGGGEDPKVHEGIFARIDSPGQQSFAGGGSERSGICHEPGFPGPFEGNLGGGSGFFRACSRIVFKGRKMLDKDERRR